MVDNYLKYVFLTSILSSTVSALVNSLMLHGYSIADNLKFKLSSCPLIRRISLAIFNVLSYHHPLKNRLKQDWILVAHLLSHPKARRLLDPLADTYRKFRVLSGSGGCSPFPYRL